MLIYICTLNFILEQLMELLKKAQCFIINYHSFGNAAAVNIEI